MSVTSALSKIVCGLAGVIAATNLCAQQFPNHEVNVDLDFTGDTSLSFWVNGFLPKFSRGFHGPASVWLVDRDGKTVIPPTQPPFDLTRFEMKATTSDPSGNLYVSAVVWHPGGTESGAIWEFHRDGKPAAAIETGDFLAMALTVTKEGDIWAFGQPVSLITARETKLEYDTVRHYDAAGQLVGSMLPRSRFGETVIPTFPRTQAVFPHMDATSTRIGLYVPATMQWIEIDPATLKVIADVAVSPPRGRNGEPAELIQIVITESNGSVYAGFSDQSRGAGPDSSGLYWLDRETRRWIAANSSGKSPEYQLFSGRDGDDLIFRAGSHAFGWFKSERLKPDPK